MKDLEIAKKRLHEKSLTLSIVKEGDVIFETVSHGISGFLEAIEEFGDTLKGASVADRITGKAIALLCVYSKVKAVYAITISEGAKAVFENYAVYHEWDNIVENILDINKAKICPFEKLTEEISDSAEAYEKLKTFHKSFPSHR